MAIRFVAKAFVLLWFACSAQDAAAKKSHAPPGGKAGPGPGAGAGPGPGAVAGAGPGAAAGAGPGAAAGAVPGAAAGAGPGAAAGAAPGAGAGAAPIPRAVAAGGLTGEVFDVLKFGAVGDGSIDNVEPFMAAWLAACRFKGKAATLLIPPGQFILGQTVFEGPCSSSDPITIEVHGTLLANPDVSAYPSGEWLMVENVNRLIIRGKGVFDGQGATAWKYNDCKKNPSCQMLPTSLKFNKVNNTVVQDITSLNSKGFHYFITNSFNFTCLNVIIDAPDNSPNTDGIHLSRSDLINIVNCTIKTGDDCVSVGQGMTNVAITDSHCGPGHGFSIGSLGKYPGEKDVKGIRVTNCRMIGTTNGARIKTWAGSPPSQAISISFEGLTLESVKNPIIIDQKYGSHAGKPSSVKISDVLFKNIKGTTTSKIPVTLLCSELVPCTGVRMEDIDLTYTGDPSFKEAMPFHSSCVHAIVTHAGKQNPPPCASAPKLPPAS